MNEGQKAEAINTMREVLVRQGVQVVRLVFTNNSEVDGFLVEFVNVNGVVETAWLPMLEVEVEINEVNS